ncbi:MAG TPA: ABC transporter ATP-binding protein [Candidatus Hydrogenedentes bacterium]|nr:ABC transporter ATP-binding protein [Candidatus Hydrogenedentota bacterium]HQE81870.1 ABC transporter ATP-binding protein [Candidatus Hydrogenedentota bacterium]HQH51163.1 ABC transporter ATP-binding protein [Candidatus Hydrogenedentota bacterium]HQM47469.1 ABC transporter ATP-binding protein [Candidatus Hydrogenedentota bacterium]
MCSDVKNNGFEAVIEVRNLVAHYGEQLVLNDVTLEVPKGEIFVVIGGSGCGKTTLLKHMTGLLTPTSGHIYYSGTDITTLDEDQLSSIQRHIGIAFQSGALFNSLTVGENVALPMREYTDMQEDLIEAMVLLKLSLVGLSAAKDLLPEQLSGGMKKRAGLARAIALDPPIVYFDEPSAGLDPIMASGLDDLILDLKRLLGITFIIVTHELDSIKKIADHVLMLDGGQAVFRGTVQEAQQSSNKRVRQFFERKADAHIQQHYT